MKFRICCENLKDNLYDPDGKTWGIGLSKYMTSRIQSWKPEPNSICVMANEYTPLFDIKYCPYCGKQLQLVEELCNHELECEE